MDPRTVLEAAVKSKANNNFPLADYSNKDFKSPLHWRSVSRSFMPI